MTSSSQNQPVSKKANRDRAGDRIDRLPEEILVHILSFLPTEDAVRTSVLSTRWEHLWTLVPNLYFCPKKKEPFSSDDDDEEELDFRYMNFIEMVLLLHKSNVEKFHIDCRNHIDESRLFVWLNALLKHNKVHDIDISGYGLHLCLPRNLFTCKTLVTLKISHSLHLDVLSSIHFPSLKVLHVSVEHPSNDLTERLFCSAPVLEELSLEVFRDSGKSVYNISSPFLKKLRVFIDTIDIVNFDCVVNVDAPVLEALEVADSCFAHYVFKNSSSLVTACVSVHAHSSHDEVLQNKFLVNKLIMLLKSVSVVKDLKLDYRCTMAVCGSKFESNWPVFANVVQLELGIYDDYEFKSFTRWPRFPNLKHLHLNVDKGFAFKNLPYILALAPNLFSLVFVKRNLREDEDNREHFGISEQGVPSCLLSSLREIEFPQFDGLECELNVIKYLLINARVLEKLTVRASVIYRFWQKNNGQVKESESEIAMMPRRSKQCEIVFI